MEVSLRCRESCSGGLNVVLFTEIVPRPGASEACDAALADIYRIEEELESVFEDIKSRFK